jgi:hypothetical protein
MPPIPLALKTKGIGTKKKNITPLFSGDVPYAVHPVN